MAGLVPAIHVLSIGPKTWMPATGVGMTAGKSSLPDLIRQSMPSVSSAWTTGSSPVVTSDSLKNSFVQFARLLKKHSPLAY